MFRTKDKKNKGKAGAVKKADKKKMPQENRTSMKNRRGRFNPFRLFTKIWFWVTLLVLAAAAVAWWQRDKISNFVWDAAASTMGLFGWGIVLLGLAALIILIIVFRHEIADFARRWKLYHWNKVLGAIMWFAAVWGILGIFDLGGMIGNAIIDGETGSSAG